MEVKKEVLCLNLSAKTLCKKDIHKTKEFDCYKTKKGGGSSNFNIWMLMRQDNIKVLQKMASTI